MRLTREEMRAIMLAIRNASLIWWLNCSEEDRAHLRAAISKLEAHLRAPWPADTPTT